MAKKKTLDWFITKYGYEEGNIRFAKNARFVARERHIYDKDEAAIKRGDAIRCAECSSLLSRIQHTHLRNKCTGRFSTVSEYARAHPSVLTVAPNLAKKTAITRNKFDRIYSPEEAAKKWESYVAAQAKTNTLDYKVEKFGWTKTKFDEYNASRAATLDNFIARHGEVDGKVKWDAYRDRQRYTTTREYFISQYGADGERRWNDFCKGRASSAAYVSAPEKELITWLQTNYKVEPQFILPNHPVCFTFDALVGTKSIVEFNGDYWHCNPSKFPSDYYHQLKQKTASEIWDHDASRITTATTAGYRVFTVWEEDWKCNKTQVKTLLLEWLSSEQQFAR